MDLKNQIKSSLADCCSTIGFDVSKNPTFYNQLKDIVRIIHIDFLNVKNATYFNSNTTSFTINLGIYFIFENQNNIYPKEYEAQIRGTLIKDFYQKNPMGLKCFSLFHPERRRRDIWWVEKDGSNLEALLAHASRIIKNKAMIWLDSFSDIEYAIKYLKTKKEVESWKGGPFGFGVIGSPCRQNLINSIENKDNHCIHDDVARDAQRT